MKRYLVFAVMAAWLVVGGCIPLQQNPEPTTPLAQAQATYDLVAGAIAGTQADIEQARLHGLVTDGEWAQFERINTDVQAAMKAWKNALIAAEANGGALPANHPAVMEVARTVLSRLTWLLYDILERRRQA